MAHKTKVSITFGILFTVIALFVFFLLYIVHTAPDDEMSKWMTPNRSLKTEWSHTDLAPGTPSSVVTTFGSFSSAPALKCNQIHTCTSPQAGSVKNGLVYVPNGVQEFSVPENKLDQVRSFLSAPGTTCTSTAIPEKEAFGILCINSNLHKFLFNGVS